MKTKEFAPPSLKVGHSPTKKREGGGCLWFMSKYSSFQTMQIVYSPSFYLGISPGPQTQKKKKEKFKNSFYEKIITMISGG